MSTTEFKLKYRYSVPWLIFWVIVFFPIALILMATGCYYTSGGRSYFLRYEGSRGWLAFWTLFFFPVAIVLLICNGCSWIIADETHNSEQGVFPWLQGPDEK